MADAVQLNLNFKLGPNQALYAPVINGGLLNSRFIAAPGTVNTMSVIVPTTTYTVPVTFLQGSSSINSFATYFALFVDDTVNPNPIQIQYLVLNSGSMSVYTVTAYATQQCPYIGAINTCTFNACTTITLNNTVGTTNVRMVAWGF